MKMDAVRRGRASDWKVFSDFQASVLQVLLFLLSLLRNYLCDMQVSILAGLTGNFG